MTKENETEKGSAGAEAKPDGKYSETVGGITWDFEVKDGKENGSGESFESQDGVLYSKEMAASDLLWGQGKTIVAYPPDGKGPFAIPDSVTSIGNNAFSECHDLKSIRADYSINLSLNQILPSLQYLDEDEVRSFQLHPEKDGGKPQ